MIKEKIKIDHNSRTFIFACASLVITISFAIYNGVLGLLNESIWNICIFAYYVFLLCIKGVLVLGIIKSNKSIKNRQYLFVYISYILLILITIAMIAPAVILVQNKREYNLGLIPAIISATYTTYSITMSVRNMFRVSKTDNILIKQIRLINLVNALMSVLVLQNTLIVANGGFDDKMTLLSTYTSIGVICIIVFIIVFNYVQIRGK